MPHKRNHGNRRINRVINQFITNVPEIRVPTPEDIEESIVVIKQVIADLDFYYTFVDEDWQEVITVDVARDLLNRYLNEYLLIGENPEIPNENAGDREDCGEFVDIKDLKDLEIFFKEEGLIASNRELYLPTFENN